ncbi:hypothetical protein, partial [Arthrobacter oryzae]|uniref:hypothetical protein n=1 Tax=Arthrobacter oryzae TaxID=409290 RepID=UPI0027838DE1
MAISNDLKPLTPEELPADNALAEAPPNEKPESTRNTKTVIGVPAGENTNPAVLDPEDGAAEGL